MVKDSPDNAGDIEMWVESLGQEDPLKKEVATHSSILAWRIPQTEKHGKLQSRGLQRVGHDRAANTSMPTGANILWLVLRIHRGPTDCIMPFYIRNLNTHGFCYLSGGPGTNFVS